MQKCLNTLKPQNIKFSPKHILELTSNINFSEIYKLQLKLIRSKIKQNLHFKSLLLTGYTISDNHFLESKSNQLTYKLDLNFSFDQVRVSLIFFLRKFKVCWLRNMCNTLFSN